ncbi:MAG TPA: DUF2975 domain-containing protein [Candidatus Phocaeicola excrementigallinarum]|nr:DUF2975 domain-containing protein [Candidatus Phocaeicola excrementigallinarum]
MKYISLLAILTIIGSCIELTSSLFFHDDSHKLFDYLQEGEGYEEYKAGETEGLPSGSLVPVIFNVIPEKIHGQATLQAPDRTITVPYATSGIACKVSMRLSTLIFMIGGAFIFAGLGIYAIYCLVRLSLRVSKSDIFSRQNVKWIRWFAYVNVGINIFIAIYQWLLERDAMSQIVLHGYQVTGIEKTDCEWSILLSIILFTEIYAAAVKIKEEQDLTI